MPHLVGFEMKGRRDDGDDALREFLFLHGQWKRDRRLRMFFVHGLAALGVVTWIAARWPLALPPEVLKYALLVWALLFAAAAASGISEWVTRRRLERTARSLGEPAPAERNDL